MTRILTHDKMEAYDDSYEAYCSNREIQKIGECSLCHTRIHPIFICEIRTQKYLYLILECPECGELIIVQYNKSVNRSSFDGWAYSFKSMVPKKPHEKEFYKTICNISKVFKETYNQSHVAETFGLDQIAGIGYRRSLEFLIKDYLKYRIPEKADEIEKRPISQCIEMIDNINIKRMAKGATWLGNDETHYIRKWENKDIKDLKNLIDLTLSWMELELKTEEYAADMNL